MPRKISVIIPVFNARDTISLCLDTLLGQIVPVGFEIIVVNDGSTDGTGEILGRYADKVTVINQNNSGPAAARNNGATAAQGEILIFTDSDCSFDESFLYEITAPLLSDSSQKIAGVQGRYKTLQKELMARFCQEEIEERYDIYRTSDSISMVGTYAAAYRRSVFMEMGMFDTRFPIASGEDAALSLKMSKAGYRLVFQDSAICYHIHPSSIKKYYRQKYGRAYWRNLLYRLHPDKMFKDSYTPQMLKIQIFLILLSYAGIILYVPEMILFKKIYNLTSLLIAVFTIHSIAGFSLMRVTAHKDRNIIALVPIYSLVRSIALANGLIAGYFNLILRRQIRSIAGKSQN